MAEPITILLVDDDEVDRLAVTRALRSAGIDAAVEEAETVSGAVAALRERTFSCVLLDYQLPEGDGLDVLRTVRQAGVDTPVVILTGRGDEQTAVELMKAGAVDYLPKYVLSADRLAQSLRYATERHRLQQERDQLLLREQEARYEAERANAAKDQFLATLSHELRTPLNAIMGWAALLRDRRFDRQRLAHGLAVIQRNAQAQADLVNDLLDVSRITSGKLELHVGSVDLAKVCDAALDVVRPAMEAKHIRAEKAFAPHMSSVSGDAARLQQVVWNLLSNAVKFSPQGETIRLELRRRDTAVEIVVVDRGCGIAPEFLPRVFERFTQAATRPVHGGLGLGLAIVRQIVELHGGTVRAASDGEGRGACFTVTLPAGSALRPSPPVRSAGSPARAGRLDGIRVMFVDDNADARQLVEIVLAGRGATVATYETKDAALAALERDRPDVLVSDIEMPDGDGYEMIRALRLREDDAATRIPAIALTGTTRADDRIRMLSAGFQIHVPKPVDAAELVAAVAALASSTPRAKPPRSTPRR